MELEPLELHAYLDHWRLSRGWSIQRLADELNVSQSLVSKWLHSDRRRRVRPNRATLRRLAEMTGMSPLTMMRMAGYIDDEDLDPGAGPLDPDLAAVNAVWPRLESGVRKAIRGFAEAGARGLIDLYLPAPACP